MNLALAYGPCNDATNQLAQMGSRSAPFPHTASNANHGSPACGGTPRPRICTFRSPMRSLQWADLSAFNGLCPNKHCDGTAIPDTLTNCERVGSYTKALPFTPAESLRNQARERTNGSPLSRGSEELWGSYVPSCIVKCTNAPYLPGSACCRWRKAHVD